jgi:opacity protein-like surface antigen
MSRFVVSTLLACVALAGCAGTQQMTQATPQPMQQAPERTPQPVRTPLPPQTATPAPSQPQAPASATAPSPLKGAYVKLDTGYSWAKAPNVRDDDPTSPNCVLQPATGTVCNGALNSVGSSFILGAGVGYRFPLGFRVDVTYQNRGGFNLTGSDPAGTTFDPKVASNAILLNGYYDIPYTIAGRVTPFVGGGIGWTKNKMDHLMWNDQGAFPSSGGLPGGSWSGTAWQLTVGADVKLTDNWVLEIGYRYVDLGKIIKEAGSGTSGSAFNAANYTTPLTGKLRANEFLLNFRYDL